VQRHGSPRLARPGRGLRGRAQRLEIADAILASGSDDEATWLAIMEAMTGTAGRRTGPFTRLATRRPAEAAA